jgi:hypothetical protein
MIVSELEKFEVQKELVPKQLGFAMLDLKLPDDALMRP